MSTRETSPEIASLAARVHNEQPRDGDQNLAFNALLVQAKKLAGSCLSQTEEDDGDNGPRIAMTATVDWSKITNAITGFVEGGMSDWGHINASQDENSQKLREVARGGEHTVWYNDPSFWIGGGIAEVCYDDPESDEGETKTVQIARADLRRGLTLMAEKSPAHFADLLNENDDAITHDVFLQYVVLGEIVYG